MIYQTFSRVIYVTDFVDLRNNLCPGKEAFSLTPAQRHSLKVANLAFNAGRPFAVSDNNEGVLYVYVPYMFSPRSSTQARVTKKVEIPLPPLPTETGFGRLLASDGSEEILPSLYERFLYGTKAWDSKYGPVELQDGFIVDRQRNLSVKFHGISQDPERGPETI